MGGEFKTAGADNARARRDNAGYCDKSAGLVVLGEQPLVVETPESLLDDDTTPTDKFYIRNNGLIPERTRDPEHWTLTIDGEVDNPLSLTLGELKANFETVTLRMADGMRRQRPRVFRSAGPGQSVDQWRGRLCGMDRRAPRRCSDSGAAQATAVFSGHFGADPALSAAKPTSRRCRAACRSQS